MANNISNTIGYLKSAKKQLTRFFEADSNLVCKDPEKLIQKLIDTQGFTIRLLIRGYLSGSNVGTNVKKIEKHLETLKTNRHFIEICNGSNEGQAEELAKIVIDTAFDTPGLSNMIMKHKRKYNNWKENYTRYKTS